MVRRESGNTPPGAGRIACHDRCATTSTGGRHSKTLFCRIGPYYIEARTASVGRQATLSVGTYRMVRVGETRPSAGMYRDSRKSPFSPRSSHVNAPSVKGASRGRLMTGSPESILVPVYGRVVTLDPWRHVTFVNYQNGYGRAED